jgi:hypothetical protein
MEFGALIPLYYMGLCCLIFSPIFGVILLLIIRFKFNDLTLARNILRTVMIVCFIWFLLPIVELIIAAIQVCRYCPESTFKITGQIFIDAVVTGLWRALIPGAATGFLVAFFIVTPIVVIGRARKERLTNQDTSNLDWH